MISCMPSGKAAQLKNVEFVILKSIEFAAENGDNESLMLGIFLAEREQWHLVVSDRQVADRVAACMEVLIQHAFIGSLDSEACFLACNWLGIREDDQAPLVARTLALAQSSAFLALLTTQEREQALYTFITDHCLWEPSRPRIIILPERNIALLFPISLVRSPIL